MLANTRLATGFLLLVGALSAQSHLVVPSAFTAANGTSRALVPGVMSSAREQIMIGASHLTPLIGLPITALELKRHAFDEVFPAGSASLTVTMSESALQPLTSSEVFSANVGPSPLQVFSGTVQAPASPAPGPGVVGWTVANTIRVPFQTPFVYTGGTLCVDISGTKIVGQSSLFWTADAASVAPDASVVHLGPGTGANANELGQWSFLRASELVPGGQAQMTAFGPANSFAVAIVGHPALSPIPLNPLGIGAPGAAAYIDQFYETQLVLLAPPSVPVTLGGVGTWNLQLPNESWLLGAEIASQWLELSQWDVSNGIRWTVATLPSPLDMAQIVGEVAGAKGQRTVNAAHIIRFEYTPP